MTMNSMSQRRTTRLPFAGLTVSMCVAAAACSATGPGSSSAKDTSDKQLIIGHSYQDLSSPYFADERKVEKALAAKNGYSYVATQASNNPATQLTDIENLISRKVNLLVIDAIDPNAVVPGIKSANSAGIPVVMLIRKPAGGNYKSLVYLDSIKDGANACAAVATRLGGKGKVVNLTGPLDILAAKERSTGCTNELKKYPGITVVASPQTDFTQRDAEQKMTDVLQVHRDVDAVFGGNDDIALGAIRAFTSAGIDPKTKVVIGIDGTQAGLQAVCNGTYTQSLATFPVKEAEIVMDIAAKIHRGKPVQKEVLFPAVPVNADNIKAAVKTAGYPISSCPAAK
ncbi:sugar ABC transporter substrate-binding protein [Streptomyces bottropensis]|uniref:sugar ABC transporter substrate-binding protein n=1 Tax=Streptomyces bottropensis TaxID=42235 RepID=UPI003693DED6